MLAKIKHTLKHTAIYSLGNLGAKLIGLLLLPIYTEYLSPSQYGVLSILEITSQFAVAVLSLKLASGMLRWCSQENDEKKRKSIVFTTYITVIFTLLFFNLGVAPFSGSFSKLLFDTNDLSFYFDILWLWASFEILNQTTINLIRFKEKSSLFVLLFLSKLTIILGLNIYFLVFLELGVKGIIISQLIGNLVMFIATIPIILKNINFKFSYQILIEMSRFSVPLIFSTISMMVLTLSDRYMIRYFLNFSEVGIYSLGYKLASVINLFLIQSFQMGFLPIAYKTFDKPGAPRFFSKVTTYYIYVMVFMALVIVFFSKEVIILFAFSNPNYWVAYTVVPLLTFSFILRGINYVVSLGLHYVKKTKYNGRIVLIAAVVNILLNLVLIPEFGIYGAAYSTIISTFLMMVLFYIFSQKHYPIQYEIGRIIKIMLAGSILFALTFTFQNTSIWLSASIKLLLLFVFPFLLLVFRFYEPIELDRIKGAWKKWRNPGRWKKNLKLIKFK
jgi:O-antigen/teichoic acid export membrane protein